MAEAVAEIMKSRPMETYAHTLSESETQKQAVQSTRQGSIILNVLALNMTS